MQESPSKCATCGSWWRLPLLLGVVLVAMLLLRNGGIHTTRTDSGTTPPNAPAEAAKETVVLSIDFGDGRRQDLEPVAWRSGMTVRDLTRESRRENLKLVVKGTGASAFLASLDGVENEGADGRNWMYQVNGEPGDRSFAIYELAPSDRVLWTFGKPQ
jgi:hypothetical protein